MIKMYRTSYYDNRIEEKEITKVSEKFVFWISKLTGKEERESIKSNYHVWHKSKEDAVLYLKNKWETEIRKAESEIERAKNKLSELGF